jgi:hypothetical protein
MDERRSGGEPEEPERADGPAQESGYEPAGGPGDEAVRTEGPQPLGVGVTPTGNVSVDAQLERLADADHLAASGHLEVYEDVHRGLRDALAALDQRSGPPGAPGPSVPPAPSPSMPKAAPYDNNRS